MSSTTFNHEHYLSFNSELSTSQNLEEETPLHQIREQIRSQARDSGSQSDMLYSANARLSLAQALDLVDQQLDASMLEMTGNGPAVAIVSSKVSEIIQHSSKLHVRTSRRSLADLN